MAKFTVLQVKALNEALDNLRELNLYRIKQDLSEKVNELEIESQISYKIRNSVENEINKQDKYITEAKNWISALLQEDK